MTEDSNLPAVPAGHAPMVPESPSNYGATAPDEEPKGPGLKRYAAALYRHKWIILILTLVGGAVSVYATRFVRLQYMAEATFWFDGAAGGLQGGGPIQSGGLLPTAAWIELMRSFTVLEHVAREQRLYVETHPEDGSLFASFDIDSVFRPGQYTWRAGPNGQTAELRTSEGILVESVQRGQPVGRDLGFIWTPPAEAFRPKREVAFNVVMPREAARELSRVLTTRLPTGNFLGISYTTTDPERAAAVVNAVGERFMEVASELKRAKMENLRDILVSQLEFAHTNLRNAELALQGYGVQTITLPTDVSTPVSAGVAATQSTVMTAFFDMKIRRQALELDAQAIARALPGEGGDSVSVDALSAVGAVQGSPEISRALQDLVVKRAEVRALLQQYTPEHPTVRQAQEVVTGLERRTIPALARTLLGEVESRIAVLDDLIGGASEELREIPPRSIEEARLKRAVAIAEVLYNDLHQRHETARLAAETTVPDVSVLDRASPPSRPTNDPRIQLILMGLAGAFGLGVAIALVLDRADPRLRYAEQVTDEMRLGIIGAVPSLRRARKGLLAPGDGAKMTEALRAVRLALMHAYGSSGPIAITITSPGSGDGKTFITSNVALTFADLGMRTLVIDGDTRRGQLHHLFDVDRKPGLTDYLAGSASLRDVVRPTAYPMVDLLPLGSRRQDAPELLSSARMGDLLAEIRPQYEVILIDSPPLGAGVDPLVLATLSGSLLMVMRTGRTDRAVAEAKLRMLDRLPVRVLGVVLNGFDTEDAYRYYSYLPGYETGSEEADSSSPELLQPV